jgi:putative phosphonate metabolism protein
MTDYTRYSVFYAPPSGSELAAFGASWLGWDAGQGTTMTHPVETCGGVCVADITATPRKYGFHGTLKPPFRLASGTDRAKLSEAISDLAARTKAFEVPRLRCVQLGRFCALVPSDQSAPLAALARACVTELDTFRAPATEAELSKRRVNGLTPVQDALLERWGYPYVLDEFRFHLTLTGPLPTEHAEAIVRELTTLTAPFCAAPLMVGEICVFGEAPDGLFHILERHALTA